MGYAPSKPLIVVPAFNEEQTVAACVREVFEHNPGVSCLVVDDGSTDRTSWCASAVGAHVLTLPFNLGVGGAMRAGFKYAARHGYDAVVQVDADGQHDPSYVPDLLACLATSDVVVGSRFAAGGSFAVSRARRVAFAMLRTFVSARAGTALTDTSSGFRAAGPRAVELYAVHYPVEYLGDTVESLVLAAAVGLRIREVPVVMRARQGGVPSQSPMASAAYCARAIFVIALAYIRRAPDQADIPVRERSLLPHEHGGPRPRNVPREPTSVESSP